MHFQPSNVVFLVGFAVYVAIRGFYQRQAKGNEPIVRQMDGIEIALLLILLPGALVLPLVYLFTPWLGFADYSLPPWAIISGAVIMVGALWLFWRSHADLGRNWSVTLEMRRGHQLITRGVYRVIRHPMYAAIWLWSVAQGLLLQNWLAGWWALLAFAVMYFVRVPREERMLREFFGPEYAEYSARTGRIFPRIKFHR